MSKSREKLHHGPVVDVVFNGKDVELPKFMIH
jgi:hypothetical protein